MILPKNGRVIIIDDQHDQAMPLITALSKNNIATTYFDAKKESLPVSRFNDVRILFLDINLNGGQQPNWAIEKSIIINNIISIVEKNTPYILFVWSVNEKLHLEELKQLFNEELKEYSPIMPMISMGKDELFELEDLGEDGSQKLGLKYESVETIELLKQKINNGLKTMDSFEAIIKWESIVFDSTTEITNEIISLAKGRPNLNDELKKIYFKLAEAMWGRQLNNDSKDIATKAVSIFNNLLNDRLEMNIISKLSLNITGIAPPDDFSNEDKAFFNSKLLLNFKDVAGVFPGNVYECTDEEKSAFPYKGLIADSLYIPLVSQEFYSTNNREKEITISAIREYKNQNKKSYESFEKSIRGVIGKDCRFVKIEVSPICDYAQKKWKVNRICPAILWPSNHSDFISKSESLYVSPILSVDNKSYYLTIDFRYFSSYPMENFKNVQPIFGLKHSFLTDIQSTLSRHVNRPGITSLS